MISIPPPGRTEEASVVPSASSSLSTPAATVVKRMVGRARILLMYDYLRDDSYQRPLEQIRPHG